MREGESERGSEGEGERGEVGVECVVDISEGGSVHASFSRGDTHTIHLTSRHHTNCNTLNKQVTTQHTHLYCLCQHPGADVCLSRLKHITRQRGVRGASTRHVERNLVLGFFKGFGAEGGVRNKDLIEFVARRECVGPAPDTLSATWCWVFVGGLGGGGGKGGLRNNKGLLMGFDKCGHQQ